MKIIDITRRASNSLRHAKIRTILTALAIGVGAFTLTLTMAASTGTRNFIDQIINENFDPAELIVAKDEQALGAGDNSKPREYDGSYGDSVSSAGAPTQIARLTQDDLEKIEDLDGIESIRENIAVNALYLSGANDKRYIATLFQFNPNQQPDLLAGEVPEDLEGKLILPEGYIEPLGFDEANEAVGEEISIAFARPQNPEQLARELSRGRSPEQVARNAQSRVSQEEFEVAGVYSPPVTQQPGTELYIFISSHDAKRLNELTTRGTDDYQKYTSIFARVKNGDDPQTLEAMQDELKELGYFTVSVEETQEFLNQIVSVLQGIVVGFAFLAVIASVFGVINTQYISVLERTQQIGLMKALGMRRRDIAWLFRLEAAWIGFLGGAFGAALAILLGTLSNPWISEQIRLGEENSLLIFEPLPVVGIIIGLMFVAIIAGMLPARKAGKLDPVEALRTE